MVQRRQAVIVGLTVLAVLGPGLEIGATQGHAIAIFPPQNRAGDSAAAAVLERTLRAELGQLGRMMDAEATRNALRRARVRNGDRAAPALLRLVGGELGADWLVSATLHDADRQQVPRLTVSARVYSSATGELIWAGFQGRSGLDDRTLLGLGVIPTLEPLVVVTARKLLEEIPGPGGGNGRAERPSGARLGKVAIVPFHASTPRRGTLHAETVTEAVRARLIADGVSLVSPNLSHEILRRRQSGRWGGVAVETRQDLHSLGGADTILTGAVESYEVGGAELDPEPRVAVAMRLLDAASGRILWMGSSEREGGDGLRLFGLGRVYSRGALTVRILEALAKRLERDELLVTNEGHE